MDVYLEATFDLDAAVEPGESLIQWFRAARSHLFVDLEAAEPKGDSRVVSRALVTQDIDGSSELFTKVGDKWGHFEQCLATFPWWADVDYSTGNTELVGARTNHVLTDGSLWLASARVALNSLNDASECAGLVAFLQEALQGSNPAFARIELNDFNDSTNLDAGLRRKRRTSLRAGRQVLRGYAWVMVCPQELSVRLGGSTALEASGAFHKVIPLRSGGVLLQASETLAGYTEQVMERVFLALAPVLPEGEPLPDPAHPNLRFVLRDAGQVR
ncbi:hypothetical protein ACIF85_09155 [Streptomyces sp. NPDC086033]|uniref:hypothetical protein n=1 Tax=unclassified Streptomyces TaxID=2593676 RepID=UPI000851C834|nr:hypothetical protein [Streptomyces sp. LUP47B]